MFHVLRWGTTRSMCMRSIHLLVAGETLVLVLRYLLWYLPSHGGTPLSSPPSHPSSLPQHGDHARTLRKERCTYRHTPCSGGCARNKLSSRSAYVAYLRCARVKRRRERLRFLRICCAEYHSFVSRASLRSSTRLSSLHVVVLSLLLFFLR